jgi:hypothetical protein
MAGLALDAQHAAQVATTHGREQDIDPSPTARRDVHHGLDGGLDRVLDGPAVFGPGRHHAPSRMDQLISASGLRR